MATPQAVIANLEGEVNVTRNGQTIEVKAGDFLLPGDEITTGGNGRLGLEFPGIEGQQPAAGVMTANGKITLGEQTGPAGQQIVVMEDTECFEFTTEVAENSAAAEAGGVQGLFGAGLLGAGSGSVAGAGALAAGAFLAGGSDDSGAGGSLGGSGSGSRGGLGTAEFGSEDRPESLEEFATENLTQTNFEQSVLEPIENAVQASQNNPESTPDNIATAGEQIALAGADNTEDAASASTGEGSETSEVAQQLVDGIDGTPLGEPLSPITEGVQQGANTELSLNDLIQATPNVGEGGLVTGLVSEADGMATPLTEQVEPLDMAFNALQEAAPQVDAAIGDLAGQIQAGVEGGLEGMPMGEGGAEAGGILGGADTLQNALEGAASQVPGDMPEGDLTGTVTSGISSVADGAGAAGVPTLPTDNPLG